MRIDDEVVDSAAEEGARIVALALLAEANDAAVRLERAADEEALHDFRVALRRLRSTLRAFRPWLEEDVTRPLERRLRSCARATNRARDAEVQLAWLRSKYDALPARRHRIGLEFLIGRIEPRLSSSGDHDDLLARYRKVSRKLARRLGTYQRRVDAEPGEGPSFGGVLATLLREQLDVLRKRLDSVEGSLDERRIHKARIEAKRLRYLLEPLRGNRHADAREAVKALKRLQDLLGELHDTHVLGQELAEALVEVAAVRAVEIHRAAYEAGATGPALRENLAGSPRPGLCALSRLARERREALFVALEREWGGGAAIALDDEVRAVVAALEARAGGRVDRHRRYLLTGLPPAAGDAPVVEVQLGWLPGAHLRERVRSERDAAGARYWRGLRHGAGRARVESEEETGREVFETLWPLTEGRRLLRRRRRVKDGEVTWDVDELPGAGLWLAEVELPARAGEVPLPEWLRPFVAREVTDEPAYLSENMAVEPPPGPPATPQGGGAASTSREEGGDDANGPLDQ